ncbi:hypothetical protein KEM56_006762 [Ascosphaera pollenicola]|nr:hypothetical protein KEM56_006762 [Ascosphaera pollenicola]
MASTEIRDGSECSGNSNYFEAKSNLSSKQTSSSNDLREDFVVALQRATTLHNNIIRQAEEDGKLFPSSAQCDILLGDILNSLAQVAQSHERAIRRDDYCLDHLLRSLRSYIGLARYLGKKPDPEDVRRTIGLLSIRGVEAAYKVRDPDEWSSAPPSPSFTSEDGRVSESSG